MTDVPNNAPTECPGTQSDDAGKSSACEGCPNQSVCASGQSKLPLHEREPELIAQIRHRLGGIRYRVLILSGKGGVGKSSLCVCLTRGLVRRMRSSISIDGRITPPTESEERCTVGVLDLDLCGPSIPCLFGCMDAQVHLSQSGWSPVFVSQNLALMSMGFLLPSPDHAVIWRGPRKTTLIRQLLTDVCWTDTDEQMDFLFIDTPPGTSDEHLSVVEYLKAAGCLDGALVITTPQEVALSDVRKSLDFCRKVGLPVLGIVENMYEFVCPACGHCASVFPPTTGGAASLCSDDQADGLPLLGRLPLDPLLTRALDEGLCPFELAEENATLHVGATDSTPSHALLPTSPVLIAFNELIDRLLERLHSMCGSRSSDEPDKKIDAETGEQQVEWSTTAPISLQTSKPMNLCT